MTVSKVSLNIYTIRSPYTENTSHSESTSFSLCPYCKGTERSRQREKKKEIYSYSTEWFFLCISCALKSLEEQKHDE